MVLSSLTVSDKKKEGGLETGVGEKKKTCWSFSVRDGMGLAGGLDHQYLKLRVLLNEEAACASTFEEMLEVLESGDDKAIHQLGLFLKFFLADEHDRKLFVAAVEAQHHELFRKLAGKHYV